MPVEPTYGNPVHQEDGKWWFWDETWADRCGPYETEEEAKVQLNRYCKEILGIDENF